MIGLGAVSPADEPMPRENVEVVRRVIEANRSGDLAANMQTVVAACDPHVEFTSVVAAVEGATYRGHRGIRRYFHDIADSWKEWRNEVEEISETAVGTVLARTTFHGVGRDSGAAVEAQRHAVFVLSDGHILRIDSYASREEALEAAGLSE